MYIKEMITNNPELLLLHFAIGGNPYFLAECNTGMVLKVIVEIKRSLFGSDI